MYIISGQVGIETEKIRMNMGKIRVQVIGNKAQQSGLFIF